MLVVGAVVSYILAAFLFSPMQAAPMPGSEVVPFFQPFLMNLILFFMSGAFWSLVGITASAATNNKYMAYASPFMIYYLLIILKERYFSNLYVLYPKEWITVGQGWPLGEFGVIMVVLVLIMMVSTLFVIAAIRRLKNI